MASVTVLSNVIADNRLIVGVGCRGKTMRRNERVTVASGAQHVNALWTQSLREYEFGYIPMLASKWFEVEAIFEITNGGQLGFLLQDPKDSGVTVTQGVVAALSATTFQLYKRYTSPSAPGSWKDRKITRLKAGSTVFYVSGVQVAASVDDATGIVTIASAPAAGDVTWSGTFYVPVHFQSDALDWEMLGPHPDPNSRIIAGPTVILEEVRE